MTVEERRYAAQAILNIPFFLELWDEMEQAAINACIFAKYDDHEARQAHAAEARSLRRIRQRLEALSDDGQSTAGRRTPA
jgi:hypothetical protein